MRELLSFYWFGFKVVVNLVWLLFLTTIYRLKHYKMFLAAVFLGSMLVLFLLLRSAAPVPQENTTSEPPSYSPITSVSPQSPTQVRASIKQLEKVLALQPTHVDTLINLGLLHESLGESETASGYWKAAFEIDPSHQFFTLLEEKRYQ